MKDRSKINSKNGKKGGRPKGSKGKKTLEIEAMRAVVQSKVAEALDPLINAQISEAMGVQFLYRIDYTYGEIINPTTKRKKKVRKQKKAVQVTDPEEIKKFITGRANKKDTYYFITTQRPNSKANDSLVDRLIGKAQANLDLTSGGKTMSQILDEAEEDD